MRRLAGAGFALLPLGGDGKQPLVKFQDKSISFAQTQAIMARNRSSTYGVRLPNLAVVDVDERSDELYGIVNKRCGVSTVQTDTARGRHFYFENPHGIRHNFGDLPIDFKTGFNSFVVGPHSQRRDGGIYRTVQGVLGIDALPIIKGLPEGLKTTTKDASEVAFTASGQVKEGERNTHLCKAARKMAFTSDSEGELVDNLMYERDIWCEAGSHPVSDGEVVKIAKWAWQKLEMGELTPEGKHVAQTDMEVVKALGPSKDGGNALMLYTILRGNHGANPTKTFMLDHGGMLHAGLIAFGRDVFKRCVELLEELGVIEKVRRYKVGGFKQQYRLKK